MKDLEDYFDAARKTEPPQSLQEVSDIMRADRKKRTQSLLNLDDLLPKRKSLVYLSLTISTMILMLVISLFTFQGKQSIEQDVFVPDSQQRILHLVKTVSLDTTASPVRITVIKKQIPLLKKVSVPLHLRSVLKLPNETLALLGITVTKDEIRYEGNVKGSGFVGFVVNSRSNSVSVDDKPRPNTNEYDFYPWFLTDENGGQSVRFRFNNESELKMTNSFFSTAMDQLVPIALTAPGGKKVIFWFSQTDALMQILESAANVSTKAGGAGDPQIDKAASTIEIQLYPTITKGDVHVLAKALKSQKLEISVLNGSGEIVRVPVKNQTLDEGDHAFSMDLSEFENGLYFIRIQSQPGVTTVHRIFKN